MARRPILSKDYLGGFGPLDGTIEFYGRINALVRRDFVVLDIGAGRAWWYEEDCAEYRRNLRLIRGKVSTVYGVDLDDAVLQNRATDRNVVITNGKLPFTDQSVDLIICDYVLEHVANIAEFEREVHRVLRPGGGILRSNSTLLELRKHCSKVSAQ